MRIPSPFAALVRAANERLRDMRDRLAEILANKQRAEFEARLQQQVDFGQGGPPLTVVFFPWYDDPVTGAPDIPDLARPTGSPKRGDNTEGDPGTEGFDLPGDNSMIEFEGLPPDSGGGGGGGF